MDRHRWRRQSLRLDLDSFDVAAAVVRFGVWRTKTLAEFGGRRRARRGLEPVETILGFEAVCRTRLQVEEKELGTTFRCNRSDLIKRLNSVRVRVSVELVINHSLFIDTTTR